LQLGLIDPGSPTAGARGPPTGDAGAEARAASAMAGLPPVATGTALRRGNGRGRGPLGPEAHQEVAGGVGSARGGPAAAESMAAVADICGGIGDSVGDSRRPGSIPSARNKRRTRRSPRARRPGRGRRRAVRLGGG
jgi:hypothetical protein